DLVTHRGGCWQAIDDTAEAPPGEAWRLVACGIHDVHITRDAENLRRITFSFELSDGSAQNFVDTLPWPIHRGTYQAGRPYEQGDEVAWKGSTWRAKRDTTKEPAARVAGTYPAYYGTEDDWQLVAKTGERGKAPKA